MNSFAVRLRREADKMSRYSSLLAAQTDESVGIAEFTLYFPVEQRKRDRRPVLTRLRTPPAPNEGSFFLKIV
jgi:hypothetical protein